VVAIERVEATEHPVGETGSERVGIEPVDRHLVAVATGDLAEGVALDPALFAVEREPFREQAQRNDGAILTGKGCGCCCGDWIT